MRREKRGGQRLLTMAAVVTLVLAIPLAADAKKKQPAQRGIEGSVTGLFLPGQSGSRGVVPRETRIEGVTSEYFEFDTVKGKDNSRIAIDATWMSGGGDYDLFLQMQLPDGTWSDDFDAIGDFGQPSSGTSGDDGRERLDYFGKLAVGHYRVEVHNFQGIPMVTVDLKITFYNSLGRPGPKA